MARNKNFIPQFSTIIPSQLFDKKGRLVSYEVTLDEINGEFYAGVNQVRGGKLFGVTQPLKIFETNKSAKDWAYKTAKERLQGLKDNKCWMLTQV